jgi:hypothetical protein
MRILFAAIALSVAASLCSQAATVGETDRFVPLVLDGGGWTTSVTLVNVTRKPAVFSVTFHNEKGLNAPWNVGVAAPAGKAYANSAEVALAPGASTTVTTLGRSEGVAAGFADIIELQDQLVAGFATLTRREGEAIVEQIRIPISPANERRSVLALDLAGGESVKISWVTLTTSTVADLEFRNEAGAIVLSDRVALDDRAHTMVDVTEQWPALKDFRGTVEWTVSFPNADRYEYRTLSGIALRSRGGRLVGVTESMTLRQDQLSTSPY